MVWDGAVYCPGVVDSGMVHGAGADQRLYHHMYIPNIPNEPNVPNVLLISPVYHQRLISACITEDQMTRRRLTEPRAKFPS